MNGSKVISIAAILALGACAQEIDVFVGTKGRGNTTPAAMLPFGMIQAGPDTSARPDEYAFGKLHCSGYQYDDRFLWRFSQTHVSGTGVPAGGDFGILPLTEVDGNGAIEMLKSTESAEPGVYRVVLSNGVSCAVAADEHSAIYRFSYPRGKVMQLLVDLDWGLMEPESDGSKTFTRAVFGSAFHLDSNRVARGYHRMRCFVEYTLHFAVEFSKPVVSKRLIREGDGLRGEVWRLDFGDSPDNMLEVRIALSMTSQDAAQKNLVNDRKSFEETASIAARKWQEWFDRVALDPLTPHDVAANFRVAQYHLASHPNSFGDSGRTRYTTFSLWDTFRAAHPLYTILATERVPGFVKSILDEGRRDGRLPILSFFGRDTHCMIGHHSVPVIVDAFLKGIGGADDGIDWTQAYEAVRDTLMLEHVPDSPACWGFLKEDWNLYNAYGYYPFDLLRTRTRDGLFRGDHVSRELSGLLRGESVSRTLECAYDDACAARFAASLGRKEDVSFFLRRSDFWRNVFDASIGFVRGKNSKGEWREPFDPSEIGYGPFADNDFTEGNSYQYTWHVMHNPKGLVNAFGGPVAAGDRLDALFRTRAGDGMLARSYDVCGLIGQYAHGNEPSHHIAYFYAYTDRPWRVGPVVREICCTQYAPRKDGLCGNDDCGQMSAWYIFSALGFYPLDPCGGEYVLGAPQVPQATIRLTNGKTFSMKAKNLSLENKYVKSVTLNGNPIVDGKINHLDIMKGGDIEFHMVADDKRGILRSAPRQ